MSNNHAPTRIKRRSPLAALRRIAHDERGAAYTLSYVMVIPIYMLLICTIVEMSLLLTSKLGTVYAAFAAARTASVWSSATTWDNTLEKAKWAAVKSMVPFASGVQPPESGTPIASLPDSAKYLAAYKAYANKPVKDNYVLAKYSYAARHVRVSIAGPPTTSTGDITAKVEYDFPFSVPGVGRIIGKQGPDGRFYFTVTSFVTLPNEGPQNEGNPTTKNSLGIGYGRLE